MNRSTSAPKKAVVKKAVIKKDEKPEIFKKLRDIFSAYAPPLSVITDTSTRYELVSNKSVEFMGKKRDNMYFGAVMVQKGFVGFYLMHIYVKPEYVEKLGPELRKLLKGKSCFHINKLDETLIKQIDLSIKDGLECYRKLKFI